MLRIKIRDVNMNNLKNISIELPLKKWITFVGKSGSGKSTLADVIFDGYLFKRDNVNVPVETALFRQRVSIPSSSQILSTYLELPRSSNTQVLGDAVKDILWHHHFGSHDFLEFVVSKMGIASLQCNISLTMLSLTTFNKVRFLRFLLNNTAELLIIDELASGICFAEGKDIAEILREAVKIGYSIIAIDHSLPMIEASDYIVEMGPEAGAEGGSVIFAGDIHHYKKTENYQKMHAYMSHKLPVNPIDRKMLKIENINYRNLHLMEFSMPVNCIVNICGVSGTGKSTMLDVVFRAFDKSTNAWKNRTEIEGNVSGKAYIRRPHFVDQTPIGKNSMSTPATYTKIMDILREMYAQLPESQERGYTVSDFSYNSVGGCVQCKGKGVQEKVIGEEIVFSLCPVCCGNRYRDEINEIKIDGLSIGAMLRLPCGELIKRCPDRKTLKEKIEFLVDVGLSYLTLGQPSPSLSGGESQRIKITRELAKKLGDRSLFILDTPSRGLHPSDFDNVFVMLRRLVAKNNSMLISDNNPYFIYNSDWVIVLDGKNMAFQGHSSKLPNKLVAALGLEDYS